MKTKQHVDNPTIVYETMPILRGQSKLVSVETREIYDGVVLDTIEEVKSAIMAYGSGRINGSRDSAKESLKAIEENQGAMAVGMTLLGTSRLDENAFSQSLANEIANNLRTTGHYHHSFDYTFNAFNQTSLTCSKAGEKYILILDKEKEKAIAEYLKKSLAIQMAKTTAVFSPVNEWWFKINLENLLTGMPFSADAKAIAKEFICNYSYETPFEFEGTKFELRIQPNHRMRYCRPDDEKFPGSRTYAKANGMIISGGSWNMPDKETLPIAPTIHFEVKLSSKRYFETFAVTESDMTKVKRARNQIADVLRAKI